MPDRHSKPCSPRATQSATSSSQGSPACTVQARPPSRSTPRVSTRTTVPGKPVVGDHHVGAAGQHQQRLVRRADRLGQLALGRRLDHPGRGTAEPERRERRLAVPHHGARR